jgi:adenine phosphoribosyltransferase
MALEILKASLVESTIVKRGEYDYIVHPITDGIPRVDPKLLDEVTNAMLEICSFDCDYIMTVEALGIPLATVLSMKTGKPFNVVRKKMYGLPDEVSLTQVTGYSKANLFINDVKAGDTVVIIDDVVSKVSDIVVVIEKTDKKAEIERKIGHQIKTLVKVDVVNGKVVLL